MAMPDESMKKPDPDHVPSVTSLPSSAYEPCATMRIVAGCTRLASSSLEPAGWVLARLAPGPPPLMAPEAVDDGPGAGAIVVELVVLESLFVATLTAISAAIRTTTA